MEKKLSRREFLKASAATGAILCMTPTIALAQEAKSIQLSQPQAGSSNSLMQLLWKRSSSREFSPEPLPIGVLSNLLWAGFGINRPDGKRTAPSAHNCQDIDIYVILPHGLYVYDAKANQLKLLLAEDLRGLAGTQPYVKEAPVNLVYVSDYAKLGEKEPNESKILLSGAHTGVIAENIYLYALQKDW
ncbi:MAG: nitroreductase family protein [Syntrophorhabdales bacterium]